jgi:hypothetical protein
MHLPRSTQLLPQPLSGPRARCVISGTDAHDRAYLIRTETLFREVNEAVQVYFRVGDHTEGQFVCECSDPTCVEKVRLTQGQYADVRAHPTRFFLVPGHEVDIVDRIVYRRSGFTTVEKPIVP